MFRPAVLIVLALGLPGCAAVSVPGDPASPFSVVPEGTIVELHRPVPIPPGRARAWFQRGRLVAGHDWYHPACNLEVRTLDRDAVQTVQPGSFRVRRVQQMLETVGHDKRPSVDGVIAVRTRLADGGDWGGGPTYVQLGYHLWLESREQPNVLRITCLGARDLAFEALPPGISDIREAFGEVATLRLP
jgi:hypothetical protein